MARNENGREVRTKRGGCWFHTISPLGPRSRQSRDLAKSWRGAPGARRRPVRRALHASHLRACTFPRTPELTLALACVSYLTSTPPLLRRRCTALCRLLRGRPTRRCFDGGWASEEFGFDVYIDTLLADGADGAAIGAEALQSSLPMKPAVTLSSWSTSPSTLPRQSGRPRQSLGLRWPRARVWDPYRARRE